MFLKSPQSLILASTSAHRRALLARVQIPFECVAPGVDETPHPDEDAVALTTRLARAKACAVAVQRPGAWVIGSDQVAVLRDAGRDTRIMGKPGSAAHCIEQLLACSGRTLAFVTAVTLTRHADASPAEFVDTTRVTFRALDRATIERYVERESPLDCAGVTRAASVPVPSRLRPSNAGSAVPHANGPPTASAAKSFTCHTVLRRVQVSAPPSATSRMFGSSSAVISRSHTSRYAR